MKVGVLTLAPWLLHKLGTNIKYHNAKGKHFSQLKAYIFCQYMFKKPLLFMVTASSSINFEKQVKPGNTN